MIPYAGQGGPHNSKEGKRFLFGAFGVLALVLGLGAGIFDRSWMPGPFIGAGFFLLLAWFA